MTDLQQQLENFLKEEANAINLSSPVLDKKYWARPSFSEVAVGDESVDTIYHAVGYALSQWETLENNIFNLYIIFCEVNNVTSIQAIRRSFGTFDSSSGRRKAIIEAAKVYFNEDVYQKGAAQPYREFFARHISASDLRNDIAHGVAYGFTVDSEEKGNFLFPTQYNTGRNNNSWSTVYDGSDAFSSEKYRYNSKTIYEIARKFGELTEFSFRLMTVAQKINGIPKIVLADMIKNQR